MGADCNYDMEALRLRYIIMSKIIRLCCTILTILNLIILNDGPAYLVVNEPVDGQFLNKFSKGKGSPDLSITVYFSKCKPTYLQNHQWYYKQDTMSMTLYEFINFHHHASTTGLYFFSLCQSKQINCKEPIKLGMLHRWHFWPK